MVRSIGTHKALVALLEGKPLTPAQSLANGDVDHVVPQHELLAKATELGQ